MSIALKDYTDAIDALIAEKRKDQEFSARHGGKEFATQYEWTIMGLVEAKAAVVKMWRGRQEL